MDPRGESLRRMLRTTCFGVLNAKSNSVPRRAKTFTLATRSSTNIFSSTGKSVSLCRREAVVVKKAIPPPPRTARREAPCLEALLWAVTSPQTPRPPLHSHETAPGPTLPLCSTTCRLRLSTRRWQAPPRPPPGLTSRPLSRNHPTPPTRSNSITKTTKSS